MKRKKAKIEEEKKEVQQQKKKRKKSNKRKKGEQKKQEKKEETERKIEITERKTKIVNVLETNNHAFEGKTAVIALQSQKLFFRLFCFFQIRLIIQVNIYSQSVIQLILA